MRDRPMAAREWIRAVLVGLGTAAILAAVIVPLIIGGQAQLPKPIAQAVTEALLGREVSLAAGMVFHIVYFTGISVAAIAILRDRLTLRAAMLLSLVLWLFTLFALAPLAGWGFLGLRQGPEVFIASFVPNALYGPLLWGLYRLAFDRVGAPKR